MWGLKNEKKNILICTISISDLSTQPQRSGVCVKSVILFGILGSYLFHNIRENFHRNWENKCKNTCNWENKGHFWIGNDSHVLAWMFVYTSFTLIWYATLPLSEKKLTFDPNPGVEGVCKDRIFAFMVLFVSQFRLTWYATWLLSVKKMLWPFDLTTRVDDVSVGKIFATMLLHDSSALI